MNPRARISFSSFSFNFFILFSSALDNSSQNLSLNSPQGRPESGTASLFVGIMLPLSPGDFFESGAAPGRGVQPPDEFKESGGLPLPHGRAVYSQRRVSLFLVSGPLGLATNGDPRHLLCVNP